METQGFSKISGIGAYLPGQVVTSEELMHEARSRAVGIPETFIGRAIGIKRRRFSPPDESFADLAIKASRKALDDAGIDPLDIDMILFCGIERDCPEPSTAHTIQAVLGAVNAECLDVSNACLGVLNGLSVANAYIGTGSGENILVCTGEKNSILTLDVVRQLRAVTDKRVFRKLMGALTLGDAGGAFMVSRKLDDTGCRYLNFKSAGRYANLCYYKHTMDGIEFEMFMEEINNKGIALHKNQINKTYKKLNWSPSCVGKIYCHQVGVGAHTETAAATRQPLTSVPMIYDNYGNVTSATFPVTMSIHRPAAGEKALLLGAGSGLSICQIGVQF